MHAMPGLPVLHSRDLVNWRLVSYAFERLDLGPEFRLEGGKEMYGQGIWAPSFRYHNGTYYIFANVNRFGLQVFATQHVGALGDLQTATATLPDITANFWSLGAAIVIR
jgi:beta-xylosidase